MDKKQLREMVDAIVAEELAKGVKFTAECIGRRITIKQKGREIIKLTVFPSDHNNPAHSHALIEFDVVSRDGYNLSVSLWDIQVIEAKLNGEKIDLHEVPAEHITNAIFWTERFLKPLRLIWNHTFPKWREDWDE